MNGNKISENKKYIKKYYIKFGKSFSNSWKNIFKKNEPLEILSEFIYYDNYKKTIADLKEFVCDLLNYSCCPCNIKICSNKVDDKSPPYKKNLQFYDEEDITSLSNLDLQTSFYVVQLTDIECKCTNKFKLLFNLSKMELIYNIYITDKSEEVKDEIRKKVFYYDLEQKNLKLNQKVEDLLKELDDKEKKIEDINLKIKNLNNVYFTKSILYDNFQKINESIRNSICRIKLKNGKEGLGFFCKIPFPDKNNLMSVLIIKNHLINKEILENKKTLVIKVDNLELDISLIDVINYSNERCELTIIEIKEPNEKVIHYFELDERLLENIIKEKDNNEIDLNQMLYTIEYYKNKFYISLGTLTNIEFNINIKNNENSLLNVYPIININNNKLIGIYEE